MLISKTMKVAIFSDTHDSVGNIDRAIALAIKEGAGQCLLHCGDICTPETLAYISGLWRGEAHYCLGNMDSGNFTPKENTLKNGVHLHGEEASEVKIGGRSVVFQHYPDVALKLADSGLYDAVFYGHTHRRHSEYIGRTLLANPGNICGVIESPSFAVYETEDNSLKHFDI